jgi:glucose/mannose transport system permease protein
MARQIIPTTENTPKTILIRIFVYSLLSLSALYFLIPLFIMLVTSLKTLEDIRAGSLISLPKAMDFSAWKKAWSEACIGIQCTGVSAYFWNTVKMVIPAVIISTALGAINGYALTKWRFKGVDILFSLLLLGCFIPFQVIILPMARTLNVLGLANTITGLVTVHVVYGIAFTTLFFRNFYVTIPDELIRAAKIDGARFFTIFWRIILPLSPPIIVVCVIWQFTQIWNDFLFGSVFVSGENQPMMVALNNLVNSTTSVKEYNVDMASAIIAALPTLIVYITAGKYFVRGLTAGSVKG